ncbi:hypothetical protein NFI96_028732 [Prochilodus magdalenae]|nr:hypothetical protein NFI96_028732 [Prochilodus magdalenae]
MEDADKLVELFFSWQKKQEKCSEMLLDLAQELETLRCISSTTQIVGSVTSVVGFAAAGVAAFLTAGLAVPLAVGATGTVLSLSSKAVEVGWSIKTTIEAKKMIEEVEKIGREIQSLMRSLKDQYGRHAGDDASTDSSDDEECEVITRIMGALAKRNNIDVPLDLLRSFNNDTFFYRRNLGRGRPNEAALKWMSGAVTVVLLSMLNTTLNVSGKKALKSFGIIGMKTLIKRSAVVASSSLAVVMSLYDLYENCKEMLKDSHVTEASQSLRDAAKQIKEDTRKTLIMQTDSLYDVYCCRDIIKQLAEVKELIQNLGENSFVKEKDRQRILDYIQATCHDPTILFWLDTCEDETVLNIISLLMNQLALEMRERSKRDEEDKEDIHIVFVAHGSITDQFVPAASLVSENITDTLLYSPWNCLIHANAAYGIAKGCIGLQQRQFLTCRGFNTNPDPRPVLPQHWNSMRKSKHDVPQIVLFNLWVSRNQYGIAFRNI